MIIEPVSISFEVMYNTINFVPDGLDEVVDKMIYDNIPAIIQLTDQRAGYHIEVEYEKYAEIGAEKFDTIMLELTESIEKICTEFSLACSKFKDL